MFVTARGRSGFHSRACTLTLGRGGIFRVIPIPPPFVAHTYSFHAWGPVCFHLFLTGIRLGYGWGMGLSEDWAGNAEKDTTPQAVEWGGAGRGPWAPVLHGPIRPVTNSRSKQLCPRV